MNHLSNNEELPEFNRPELIGLTEGLKKVLQIVKRWQLQNFAPPAYKALRKMITLVTVLVALCALVLMGYGAYRYITTPKENEGFTATYFSQPRYKGHPFTRVDHNGDTIWYTNSPVRGVPKNGWSAHIEGCLTIDDDNITIGIDSQLEAKLSLDGKNILSKKAVLRKSGDKYTPSEYTEADKAISKGVYSLKIEIPYGRTPAQMKLKWRSKGGSIEEVPATAMIPLGGNSRHECKGKEAGTEEQNRE